MNRKIASAVLLQSIGPLSLLALTLYISRVYGAAAQGHFVAAKSWVDLAVAIACLGLPQSFVIAINKRKESPQALYLGAVLYVLIVLPVIFLLTLSVAKLSLPYIEAFLISIGISAIALVSMWRGILLTQDEGTKFHLITAAPMFIVVLVVMLALGAGFDLSTTMPRIYMISGIAAIALAYALFPWNAVSDLPGGRPNIPRLIANGAEVFLQATATSLQVYFATRIIGETWGIAEVGFFGVALLLLNSFGFPLQALSPLLLNRLSKMSAKKAANAWNSNISAISVALFAGVCVLALILPYGIEMISMGNLQGAERLIQFMVLAAVPMIFARINSLRLIALGAFRSPAIVAVFRLSVFIVLSHVAIKVFSFKSLWIIGVIWLAAEVLCALALRWQLSRHRKVLG